MAKVYPCPFPSSNIWAAASIIISKRIFFKVVDGMDDFSFSDIIFTWQTFNICLFSCHDISQIVYSWTWGTFTVVRVHRLMISGKALTNRVRIFWCIVTRCCFCCFFWILMQGTDLHYIDIGNPLKKICKFLRHTFFSLQLVPFWHSICITLYQCCKRLCGSLMMHCTIELFLRFLS